jgi:hypothetical protein
MCGYMLPPSEQQVVKNYVPKPTISYGGVFLSKPANPISSSEWLVEVLNKTWNIGGYWDSTIPAGNSFTIEIVSDSFGCYNLYRTPKSQWVGFSVDGVFYAIGNIAGKVTMATTAAGDNITPTDGGDCRKCNAISHHIVFSGKIIEAHYEVPICRYWLVVDSPSFHDPIKIRCNSQHALIGATHIGEEFTFELEEGWLHKFYNVSISEPKR